MTLANDLLYLSFVAAFHTGLAIGYLDSFSLHRNLIHIPELGLYPRKVSPRRYVRKHRVSAIVPSQ